MQRMNFLFALVLLATSAAQAQSQTQPANSGTKSNAPAAPARHRKPLIDEFTGQRYGTAGCGLGSVIFGDTKGAVQIFAATTNGTYGNQTLAISSGTSNCGESGAQARATEFINVNKVAIENDLAHGSGETVAALGEVMGCHNSDFATKLRMAGTIGSPTEVMAQVASKNCNIN